MEAPLTRFTQPGHELGARAEIPTELRADGRLDNRLMLLDCRNHNFVQLSGISDNDPILLGYQI